MQTSGRYVHRLKFDVENLVTNVSNKLREMRLVHIQTQMYITLS